MDQKKASNAQAAPSLDAAAAAHFKIDPGELGKLQGVTNNVMADFKKIDKDYTAYLNARAKYDQFPEPAMIQQFAARRRQAVMDGMDKLQKQLSPAGWAAIHDYINNVHRLRFHRAFPAQ